MKKLLFLLLFGFTLVGCVTYTNDGVTKDSTENNRWVATKFEFNGHQYIEFRDKSYSGYDYGVGYVHDPDCPCHQKESSETVVYKPVPAAPSSIDINVGKKDYVEEQIFNFIKEHIYVDPYGDIKYR